MKILFSVSHAGRSAGMWYALAVARRMAARGHQVHVLPRPLQDELARVRDAELTAIDNIDVEHKSPGGVYRNLRRMAALIGSIGPDAVLAFGGEDHALWGLAKSIWARRMALLRVRVLDPKPPRRHPLSQWLHRCATDAIVVANTRHHADYRQRLRIPPDKLHIIPSGIDPGDFENLIANDATGGGPALPQDKDIVVIVGRFAPIKGYRVFVAAARKLKETHPRAHFLVIGYQADYTIDDLKRWVVEGDLTGQFTITDWHWDNLPGVLARCAVGVISSVGSETVSRSLLEYLASGLPVVATDVGGIPDLMGCGQFGHVVKPDDSGALANAIGRLLDDPGRAQAGRDGRSHVLANCTWDRQVGKWEELLYRVVSGVRGAAIPRMHDAAAGEAQRAP